MIPFGSPSTHQILNSPNLNMPKSQKKGTLFSLKGKIFVFLGLSFWDDSTMADGSA